MPARRKILLALIGALAVVLALTINVGAGGKSMKLTLFDQHGNEVGRIHMRAHKGATEVRVEVSGLTPGFHGFHVHSTGVCDPRSSGGPFTSAGGHFNPGSTGHGGHAGDMPVLLALGNGTAKARFSTDRFTPESLMDADGSAVIIHAGSDNYANIPGRYHSHTENTMGADSATRATGDAGNRVACGVVGR